MEELEALRDRAMDGIRAISELLERLSTVLPTNNKTPTVDNQQDESASEVASELMRMWNDLGDPFPEIRSMTTKRVATVRARLADAYWRKWWRTALATLPDLPFCTGTNERRWVANVEWFLRPNTVTRIMEGCYRGTVGKQPVDTNATAISATPIVGQFDEEMPW